MDTLVICIDRDNDLGEKAKVITPVVGRGANIAAAVSLATIDPEDSDTNTIFGGIRILDELRSLGVDADIVSFAGDKNVGTISDRKIADQLDEFLSKQDVKSAIFVSDGAEDETLVPIVQSRVKIDSVRRIVVMQSENLESTYYMIKNFLKDPKFLQTFFVPIGLAFIIYAIAMAASQPELAIIGTFFIVGMYMILRAYSLNEKIVIEWNDLKNSYKTQKLSFVTTIAAFSLLIIGTVVGSVKVWEIINMSNIGYDGLMVLASLFIKRAVLWYAASIFIFILGKIFDKMRINEDYQNLIVEMLFALSGTLLFWSSSSYILSISMSGSDYIFSINYFVYSVVLSIIIALVGIYFSANPKKEITDEEEKKEDKKKTPPVKSSKPEKFISVTEEADSAKGIAKDPVKINIENKKSDD
jgi:Predicted membrane protein